MKLPPIDFSKNQRRLLWAIGIAMVLVPLAYIIRFFCHPISSNSGDWGTFGDFIGGILNPIIGLLTLIVTVIIALTISDVEKRRHDDAMNNPVKPYITLKTGDFFTSYRPSASVYWDTYYFAYSPPEAVMPGPLDRFMRRFYLKVSNKGLGPATDLSVTYEVDLNELVNLLVINEPTLVATPTAINLDEDQHQYIWVKVNQNNGAYQGNIKILAKETYGIGLVQNGKKIKAPFPDQIITAFKLYNEKRKLNKPLPDFPAVNVTFHYKNINGKPISERFRVSLAHVNDYLDFSSFRIGHQRLEE